jgi:hypothetical protein
MRTLVFKVLLLFTLLASLGLHALTEKQKSIAFMKDWVVIANGKMEIHQTNTVKTLPDSPLKAITLVQFSLNLSSLV